MAVRALPNLWRALTGPRQSDALVLDTEAKVADLSEPARTVLWHLANRSLRPHEVGPDAVLTELSNAGLIRSDFDGMQSVPPELVPVVKRVIRL